MNYGINTKGSRIQAAERRTTIYRSLKNLEHRGLVVKIRCGLVALTEDGYKTAKRLEKKRWGGQPWSSHALNTRDRD